jgi:hypothetical protein
LLIISWLLRACAPVDPLLHVSTLEANTAPAAQPPPDDTPTLRASLERSLKDGKTLVAELAKLQAELKTTAASCQPAAPLPLPAERWGQKDLSIFKGCWMLGNDGTGWLGEIGNPRREVCTTKAARWCFDANGNGQAEAMMVCPVAGIVRCNGPITARFSDDGGFNVTIPEAKCPQYRRVYSTRSCKRVDDNFAKCRKTNFDANDPPQARSEELEFRRAP